MFTGRPPLDRVRDLAVIPAVLKGRRPPKPTQTDTGFSAVIWDLTQACWDSDPERRPSASQAVSALTGFAV